MKAVVCKQWGDPSTLVVEDVPSPSPMKGEVKIAVHACGVNAADALMIQGQYGVKPPFPFIPGVEIAGEVIEVGDAVTHVRPGDRVLAACSYGCMAEETISPFVLPIPYNMDYVTAAGFPVVYGTSHVALMRRARLKAGEYLLVLGAAGGIGLAAVEIGKQLGASVIAAASTPEKLALAEQYGADYLVNYATENVKEYVREITNGKGANVIFDPVGGNAFDEAFRTIAWEGRVLVIGFASGRIPHIPTNLALDKNCAVIGVFWGAYSVNNPQVLGSSLYTLLDWYAQGKLKPYISRTYPLDQVADAMYALVNRQSTGKIVLKVR